MSPIIDANSRFEDWKDAQEFYNKLVRLHDPEVVEKLACPDLVKAEREAIRAAESPKRAKYLGYRVTLRPEWDDSFKLRVMLAWLRIKFNIPELRDKLLATGDAELVHDTPWGDTYWGQKNGVGLNWQGKLIMQVRGELRESQEKAAI